jgi:hypothetical protein
LTSSTCNLKISASYSFLPIFGWPLTPECLVSLSKVDFDFLWFLDFLLIVLSDFLSVGRACLEAGLYSCWLKYHRVTSVCGPACPRPIRAATASVMGAKTSISDHPVEERRPKDLAGFRRLGLGVFIKGPELGYNNASTLSAASACISGNTCEINVQSECRAGMP